MLPTRAQMRMHAKQLASPHQKIFVPVRGPVSLFRCRRLDLAPLQ